MCSVYHTPTGLRIGSKGPVANTPDKVAVLMAQLPKGQARQERKKLHGRGLVALAAVPRASIATA